MASPRESGILLHPTSLPGPYGIGEIGESAFRFIDWLQHARQRLWQVMPLGPTGYGDSPYASGSAFAGNPLLVSLGWLKGDGLLDDGDLAPLTALPTDHVDFGQLVPLKMQALRTAFDNYRRGAGSHLRQELETFRIKNAAWLDDYALFYAVKRAHGDKPWTDWERPIRLREVRAIKEWAARLVDEIRFHQFIQFHFYRQWSRLKTYANERSIRIIGDIPIFVAHDSVDVWKDRAQFKLDVDGHPTEVAGVPPDPFSATGQIWGNPVYDWAEMRRTGFSWWKDRISAQLQMVDIIRIDHFRGFAAAWHVPADAETAAVGHWVRSPGADLFATIFEDLGEIPFIIEDLGVITPDVVALREVLGFPGMKVLQFAFENNPSNVYLPHNYTPDSVVYSATHDNQTTVGWFQTRPAHEREAVQTYLGRDGSDIAWDLIRLALASVANTAIFPLQDVLRLGDEARMNTPGRPSGNWSWRYTADQLPWGLGDGLGNLTFIYGRSGEADQVQGENPWDYTRDPSLLG